MNRLTIDDIKSKIVNEHYYIVPGTTLTVCALTLKNGYVVIGQNAYVDPKEFNEEVGKRFAYTQAMEQVWQLEGYLLKQRLHDEGLI
jgi:hypothetical protein